METSNKPHQDTPRSTESTLYSIIDQQISTLESLIESLKTTIHTYNNNNENRDNT